MNLSGFLKGLSLHNWYMVLILISGVCLVGSLFFPIQGISNTQAQELSLGVLLICLGIWKGERFYSNFSTSWRLDPINILLILGGLVVLIFGVVSVLSLPIPIRIK